jgi:hypothetical protein
MSTGVTGGASVSYSWSAEPQTFPSRPARSLLNGRWPGTEAYWLAGAYELGGARSTYLKATQ